jgi:hypothetical protein
VKWLILVATVLLSATTWADIGTVTESTGTAVIKRGAKTVAIAKDTVIELNDRVETKNGRVKITFKDSTTVTVTESSALLIDDFVYDPKSSSGKLGLKAAAGTVRYVSGKIAHNNPNSVKINTPTAAIAVRGTDFTMSVAETGASLIILLPTCEVEQNVNLKGLTCGSGKIDVDSGGTVVTLDRPYQATIVENSGSAPSVPIVVNFAGQTVGNNLMLSPPKTGRGASIIAAAKAAMEKTDGPGGDNHRHNEAHNHIASMNESEAARQRGDTEKTAVRTSELARELTAAGVTVTDITNNEFVYKIWRDSSETQQVGWGYERLSPTGFNYANIALPLDSKALIVVTQDRLTDAYNSNTQSSRSYGTIIINQQYK